MSIAMRLRGDPEPIICGVCRRRAWPRGYAGTTGKPVLWLCDDETCGLTARSVYVMPKALLDSFEVEARDDAGDEAGAYLDTIGKTDLSTLTQDEWRKFLDKVLLGFEVNLRRRLFANAAPF